MAATVNRPQGRQAVRRCYDRLLAARGVEGSLRLDARVDVQPTGLRRVSVGARAGAVGPGLTACVRDEIARWSFPVGDRPYQIEFPLVFRQR